MRVFVTTAILFCYTGILSAKGFDINVLPRGSSVTLPQPATIFVPLDTRVTLSATDSPQSLKLTSHSRNKRQATQLEVAVYDPNSERVRYLTIKPNVPYVYSFKGLSSIMIITKAKTPPSTRSRHVLRIESDKSLTIAK